MRWCATRWAGFAICRPAFLAGRTTLIIAHRLSAVRQADRVLVFEDGRIVEEGRHEELIEGEGLYAALYRRQAH